MADGTLVEFQHPGFDSDPFANNRVVEGELPFNPATDYFMFDDLPLDLDDFDISEFLNSSDVVAGASNTASCDGANVSVDSTSPDHGISSDASASMENIEIEDTNLDSKPECGFKRKENKEENLPSPNPSSRLASRKFPRLDESTSPHGSLSFTAHGNVSSMGASIDDEKRTARLVRNRESAQLSRQRKKRYVEELEEKVKSMSHVIQDLNCKISYIMAENATLRQQLGSGCVPKAPSAVVPPVPTQYPLPGMHFPWIPPYALRPQGTGVPLVPIPKLKPQPITSTSAKSKKMEARKGEGKIKKVAGITLVGLLFLTLSITALFHGGIGDGLSGKNLALAPLRETILREIGHDYGLGGANEIGLYDGDTKVRNSRDNSSENLPVLLYVPKNGQHVKINGNLVIRSVLASEEAIRQEGDKNQKGTGLVPAQETGLLPARYALQSEVEQYSNPYRATADPSMAEDSIPQWFREGIAGPLLSSGMCTEVFQFNISPSAHSDGVVPASSHFNTTVVNATEKITKSSPHGMIKSRRIMHGEAIPLPGKTLNKSDPLDKPLESAFWKKKPNNSMVVSVLADPRDISDADMGGSFSPKSFSKIFVVVLLDGVKYVTYSCVLPFRAAAPHLTM